MGRRFGTILAHWMPQNPTNRPRSTPLKVGVYAGHVARSGVGGGLSGQNGERFDMAADTTHEIFRQPPDPNVKVWRYMDFTKYVALLESSSLWFSRIDRLGDPFEASWTAASDERLREVLVPGPSTQMAIEEVRSSLARGRKMFRDSTYVSCWHSGDHESAAMWHLYSKTDESVAVQTTYAQLVSVLPHHVLIGLVQYIDYDTARFSPDNALRPAAHKRLSYEHEREVRALMLAGIEREEDPRPVGIGVPVDLRALVQRVYVAPDSSPWYHDLVRAVTRRLGWAFEIAPSRLSDRPIF